MIRGSISGLGMLVFLAMIMLFFNLGQIPLLDPDEPVYAETPLEMVAAGNVLSPRIYGEFWYDKPPMYYWLVALSFQMFGENEFAARFPSALLGIGTVAVVYWAGRRLFSERTGWISALILLTSIEYFYIAKAAVTDMTLLFFLTLALLGYLLDKPLWLAFFAGLATVTKGPIGLVFPGAILFFTMLFTRNWKMARTFPWAKAIVIYLISAGPWYFYMVTQHGSAFVETFLGFHNVTRFTSPEHPEGVLWYFYIPVLLVGFFPWSAILLQTVWNSFRHRGPEKRKLIFLQVWAWFIFLFFSISQTKLVTYIFPMFPPVALMMGWYINRLLDRPYVRNILAWPITTTILVVLLAGGFYKVLDMMPKAAAGLWGLEIVLLFLLAGLWYGHFKHRVWTMFYSQVACMVCFSFVLLGLVFPSLAEDFSTRTEAQQFKAVYDQTSPVYVIKFLRPGFAFYSGTYGQEVKGPDDLKAALTQPGRAYAIVRDSDYKQFSEDLRSQIQVVYTGTNKLVLLKP